MTASVGPVKPILYNVPLKKKDEEGWLFSFISLVSTLFFLWRMHVHGYVRAPAWMTWLCVRDVPASEPITSNMNVDLTRRYGLLYEVRFWIHSYEYSRMYSYE